jgi:hypothetical protein
MVEIHSAISRLSRTAKLTDPEKRGALSRLDLLSHGWKEILPDDPLRELASSLLDIHELRAGHSLQLAAALTWCQKTSVEKEFCM